jgi:3-deoxy-D-manno-octulosonic-acid transferase
MVCKTASSKHRLVFSSDYQITGFGKKIGLTNSTVSGDTRFDRVKQFLDRDNHLEFIEEFKAVKS